MAASSSRSGYHQDYIARIRYSNALPPPPNPPKLLDIPGTGLASGQYTSAAFASRLAREQPLNIEADGELGMPINLIGIPGVFDGDESAIYGLENPPQPHPHDRALLRPLSMLGKPTSVTSGVSFLRRTEYISSDLGRSKVEGTTPRDFARMKQEARKRKREEFERDDDPVRMLRGIYKGFDTAYPDDAYTGPDSESNVRGAEVTAEDRTAWNKPRHPTNPSLTVLDTYPLLPDLDAFPDSGNYFVIKFMTNPTNASDSYDSRLDVTIFRPLEPSLEVQAQRESQRKAYEADPSQPPPGPVAFDYEFFLPEDSSDTTAVKAMFDVNEPSKHDPSFYDNENEETGRRFFRYKRLRAYETYQQTGNSEDQYGDTVALALHDPADVKKSENGDAHRPSQKAAYFYPIVQRTSIRPRRKAAAAVGTLIPPLVMKDEGNKVDFMDVTIVDPDEEEVARMDAHKGRYEGSATAVA